MASADIGITGARLAVADRAAVTAALAEGFAGGLVCTDAGTFPRATGHLRQRPDGCGECVAIICAAGRGWARWAGGAAAIASGQALILPPGVAHAYGADNQDPWTIHWMHVTGPALSALLLGLLGDAGRPACLPCADLDRAAAACRDAWAALAAGSTAADLLRASGPAWGLLLLLLAERAAPPAPADDPRVARAEACMRERLAGTLRLARLARVAECSAPHLTALFRRHRGRPPLDHFLRLKMAEAARLLSTTGMDVAAVGRALGYADPFYFSRRFASHHGQPPSRWRRQAAG